MKRSSILSPLRAAMVCILGLTAFALSAPELSAQRWNEVSPDDGFQVCVKPKGELYLSDVDGCRKKKDRPLALSALGGGSVGQTTSLNLVNGWTAYGGDYAGPTATLQGDLVVLEGLVKQGRMPGVIATLPEGWAPRKKLVFPSYSRYYRTRVDVLSDGSIVAVDGTSQWLTLSGIAFRVAPQ